MATAGALQLLLALQVVQASVAGTVRDGGSSAPLVAALVELSDLDRSTATDSEGRYLFTDVPAGPHHLRVRYVGYAPRTLHALVPREGRLLIDVALRAEPVRLEPVTLLLPLPVRGVSRDEAVSYPDRSASMLEIWNHPLLAEPDALAALSGGEVVLRPESPSGLHVRGGSSDQTAYVLDGIPVLNPYHAAGLFGAWNPDAVARLELVAAAPSPSYPHALSGVVAGATRAAGHRVRLDGGLSTTQARVTLDGPLGAAGTAFLLSLRSGFPGAVAPAREPSYLRGETGDGLAKLEAPVAGGRLRLLGYKSEDEISAAASAEGDTTVRRNSFRWSSRSLGSEWSGALSGGSLRLRVWDATTDAGSQWSGAAGPLGMSAARGDRGLLASWERRSVRAAWAVGLRMERSRTAYLVVSDSGGVVDLNRLVRLVAPYAHHVRTIGERTEVDLGASLAAAAGGLHFGPRARIRWRPGAPWSISGSFSRAHQFAQSVRNPESIASNVFPADLFIGAGASGVPVARGDLGVVAVEFRPAPGARLVAQAYARRSSGAVMVAASEAEPFLTGPIAVGRGRARGVAVEAGLTGSRFGVVASYGLQHVRLDDGQTSYVPEHGARHIVEAGVVVFPGATSSVRLGLAGAWGRRVTRTSGPLEWESCNLLDRGCEFGGSPRTTGPPGVVDPGPYLRLDLSLRKHWHVELGDRDAELAAFATLTNVLDRRNVLTFSTDPATSDPVPVEMRPRAPLVVGLDWRF